MLLAGEPRALDSVDYTAQNDCTGALDVIIEAGVRTAVALESGERVLEVLKLDDNTVDKISIIVSP